MSDLLKKWLHERKFNDKIGKEAEKEIEKFWKYAYTLSASNVRENWEKHGWLSEEEIKSCLRAIAKEIVLCSSNDVIVFLMCNYNLLYCILSEVLVKHGWTSASNDLIERGWTNGKQFGIKSFIELVENGNGPFIKAGEDYYAFANTKEFRRYLAR